MTRMRKTPVIFVHALILLALLATLSGPVFAQVGSVEVPENARAKEYGNGWECDLGYRAVNEASIAVRLPTNAYLTNTSYGSVGMGIEKTTGAVQTLGSRSMHTPQTHPMGMDGCANEVIGSLTLPA
jgi:hypothetical protein